MQFYIDGNLRSTAFSSPYNYGGDGSLDTSKLAQGPHVLSIRAVANDLSYAYYSAAVIVGNELRITTPSLPSGTQNVAYSTTLAAAGGVTPYAWSLVTGTLPSGLSLNSSTGVISGTPTAAGTSNFTVKVTDANSQTATQALSIVIATALTITTASLPSGTQNVAYSTTLAAAGGVTPYAWSLMTGTLPSGLSLNSSTGVISGTPTAAGTSNFTVKVTDANSQTATQALNIVIATALTITTTSLPSGTQNVAYSTTLAAAGGVTPYAWSLMTGTLPSGLSLNSSTGVISGTPTAAGTSNFTVKVTDANSRTATQALSIVIAIGGEEI